MNINRKVPTEKQMIEEWRRNNISMPPLVFRFIKSEPKVAEGCRLDVLLEVSWRKNKVKFAVECKALSTPKVFRDSINFLKSFTLQNDYRPMLCLPYLNENQLQELEREGLSGIDLCGNGVVLVPGMMAVYRSGGKNHFPSSASIKNIYRKNSSMVGRVFFSNPVYNAVKYINSEINRRNMLVNRWNKKPMSLSTVSKALSTLEQDLIVERAGKIRLLQPDKLLEKLRKNYVAPNVTERIRLKVSESNENILRLLLEISQTLDLPLAATGTSSVGQYAVMQREDMLSVYCPRLDKLRDLLPGNQTDRFPNLELVETEDETVYFDAQEEMGFCWASAVQVYLELMAGDKRDRETATQVRSFLLKDIEEVRK